jgi:hypothetical protein
VRRGRMVALHAIAFSSRPLSDESMSHYPWQWWTRNRHHQPHNETATPSRWFFFVPYALRLGFEGPIGHKPLNILFIIALQIEREKARISVFRVRFQVLTATCMKIPASRI